MHSTGQEQVYTVRSPPARKMDGKWMAVRCLEQPANRNATVEAIGDEWNSESVAGIAIRAPTTGFRMVLFVDIGSAPARQTKSMGLGVFRSCGLPPDAP